MNVRFEDKCVATKKPAVVVMMPETDQDKITLERMVERCGDKLANFGFNFFTKQCDYVEIEIK